MPDELTEARAKDGAPVEHYHPTGPGAAVVKRAKWCAACQVEVCSVCSLSKRCPHWPGSEGEK